jgi:hypothetical protein
MQSSYKPTHIQKFSFTNRAVESQHPKASGDVSAPSTKKDYTLEHPIWTDKEVHDVHATFHEPKDNVDRLALTSIRFIRGGFDFVTGYNRGTMTEQKWLTRIVFLESVAGVPGFVAGMHRHLRSLRKLQRDRGWIHTLLGEAENERMHLMTALELKKAGRLMWLMVMLTQGVFVNGFFFAYLLHPRFCHRFVGYLEEEAVHTYTRLLEDLDSGRLDEWAKRPAPEIAINYWKLPKEATVKDVFLAIRADESHHRDVNHAFGDIKPDDPNPFI